MDYLETLNQIKDSITNGKELTINHKMIVIGLVSEKEKNYAMNQDSFVFFYEDVISDDIDFDFEPPLTTPVYEMGKDDSRNCLTIFQSISKLEESSSLYNWLQNALKFADHLALHYLQEIVKEAPIKQGEAGRERSIYIQINQKKNDAEKAGRILDNLYEVRNKLEHRTVSDPKKPGYQKILPPNYRRAKKMIQKRYPEVLIVFRETFKNFYN